MQRSKRAPKFALYAHAVFQLWLEENNNLLTRNLIALLVIMNEDMSDESRAILQKCFRK
jgi:hypothetical protein